MTADSENPRPSWFVNAVVDGDDHTEEFIREGTWRIDSASPYGDLIRSVEPGDRIAIKTTYTRTREVRFPNRGQRVSAMLIKATGAVIDNPGDGASLSVNWTRLDPPREWYFATYVKAVWRLVSRSWWATELVRFTFEGKEQDLKRFLQSPFWGERYEWPYGRLDGTAAPAPEYGVEGIVDEGCFMDRTDLESMLQRLRSKHNVILQGPPGTGKTWLARKLAYALIGRKEPGNVRQIQFHPNLSYEDVVRGWRPQGDGKLGLEDGPFLELCEIARRDTEDRYVVVIEEINRGNPAAIFGELLTLLEADKKTPENALTLAHRRKVGERFYIPPNLFVIGTMNLADRSLALVDLALRRRFAMFTLKPELGGTWRRWVHERFGVPVEFLDRVAQRIGDLNQQIDEDSNLGANFRIGHSFVTPNAGEEIDDAKAWYGQVVENEIAPLLGEYWFDDPDRAAEAARELTAND